MSDMLKDILAKRASAEPPEIAAVKNYVLEHFDAQVSVSVSKTNLTIWAPTAALAGAIRMNLNDLLNSVITDKKLIIRIGQKSL